MHNTWITLGRCKLTISYLHKKDGSAILQSAAQEVVHIFSWISFANQVI